MIYAIVLLCSLNTGVTTTVLKDGFTSLDSCQTEIQKSFPNPGRLRFSCPINKIVIVCRESTTSNKLGTGN